MKTVKIMLEENGIMPKKSHEDDMGCDLFAATDYYIRYGETVVVSAGFKMALPVEEDYIWEAQIRPRSGLSLKTKMRVANSPGTVDAGYRGVVGVIIHNVGTSKEDNYSIRKGDKIAQMVITRTPKVVLEQVTELDDTERSEGGFGSTGK